ncbi:competence protein CoiA family protein [Paracoccus litorisediminis]|uniref:competence protein CoiA family protein n=1 Tax=Paracoccus litorisediminis TaxID=2006130 RepID=UPI0037329524
MLHSVHDLEKLLTAIDNLPPNTELWREHDGNSMQFCLLDGEIQHISTCMIAKNQKLECPTCSAPVIARRGQVRKHHFAHKRAACSQRAFGETVLHLAGKLAVQKLASIRCPAITGRSLDERIIYARDTLSIEGELSLSDIHLEKKLRNVVPDVMANAKHHQIGIVAGPVAVEIYVTHKVDVKKCAKFEELQLPCLEVDLSHILKRGMRDEAKRRSYLESGLIRELEAGVVVTIDAISNYIRDHAQIEWKWHPVFSNSAEILNAMLVLPGLNREADKRISDLEKRFFDQDLVNILLIQDEEQKALLNDIKASELKLLELISEFSLRIRERRSKQIHSERKALAQDIAYRINEMQSEDCMKYARWVCEILPEMFWRDNTRIFIRQDRPADSPYGILPARLSTSTSELRSSLFPLLAPLELDLLLGEVHEIALAVDGFNGRQTNIFLAISSLMKAKELSPFNKAHADFLMNKTSWLNRMIEIDLLAPELPDADIALMGAAKIDRWKWVGEYHSRLEEGISNFEDYMARNFSHEVCDMGVDEQLLIILRAIDEHDNERREMPARIEPGPKAAPQLIASGRKTEVQPYSHMSKEECQKQFWADVNQAWPERMPLTNSRIQATRIEDIGMSVMRSFWHAETARVALGSVLAVVEVVRKECSLSA